MSIDIANPRRSFARQPPCAHGMHSHQSGSPQSPEKKGWHLACSIPFPLNPHSQLGIPESKSPAFRPAETRSPIPALAVPEHPLRILRAPDSSADTATTKPRSHRLAPSAKTKPHIAAASIVL